MNLNPVLLSAFKHVGDTEKDESDNALKALALWRRWFTKSGDPVYRGHKLCCFFCGRIQGPPFSNSPPKHDRDCIYLKAKELTGL